VNVLICQGGLKLIVITRTGHVTLQRLYILQSPGLRKQEGTKENGDKQKGSVGDGRD